MTTMSAATARANLHSLIAKVNDDAIAIHITSRKATRSCSPRPNTPPSKKPPTYSAPPPTRPASPKFAKS